MALGFTPVRNEGTNNGSNLPGADRLTTGSPGSVDPGAVFHRKGDVGSDANSQGGNGGGGSGNGERHAATPLGLSGIFRARTAGTVQRAEIPSDLVTHNLKGVSTFDHTPMLHGMRRHFEPGGKFSPLQGRRLRVAGDLDPRDATSIRDNQMRVQVNDRQFNRDRMPFYTAGIPLKA